jgi:hypothetical protein
LLAYHLLGVAVLAGNGGLSPALVLAVAGFWVLVVAPLAPSGAHPSPGTMAGLVGLHGVLALIRPIGSPTQAPWLTGAYYAVMIVLVVGLLRACVRPIEGRERSWVLTLLGVYMLAGTLVLFLSPTPRIDVFVVQQEGAADLLAGRNPYAASFTNPYGVTEAARFFGKEPGALTHYPYAPLSAYATTVAYAVGHDVRWALLAAQAGAAWLLWRISRRAGNRSYAFGVLGLFLLHPRGTFVLEQAWTEPLVACAAALVVSLEQPMCGREPSGERGSGWISRALAIGVVLASKQYAVLVLPLFARGLRPLRTALAAVALAGLLTVPLFLWGARDFVDDVLLYQIQQPFRPDALSLPGAVAWLTGWRAPSGLSPLFAGLALVWVLRRMKGAPRNALRDAAPAWGAAVVFFAFFLTAKQAFCNYYYFVGALLLTAAAASPGFAGAVGAASVEDARVSDPPLGDGAAGTS